jgi:DNA-binding response OmpR family regulator
MRLLLAEDEMEMASVLILALRNHDLIVDHVATLAAAQEAIRLTIYDALLLDRHLPDGMAHVECRALRRRQFFNSLDRNRTGR